MSTELKCDLCGETIGSERGVLFVYEFDDGYNTDTYNSEVDICSNCINDKIGKDIVMSRRVF